MGAVLSGVVAIIAAATKFTAGAWIVVILIPLIVGVPAGASALRARARARRRRRPGPGSRGPGRARRTQCVPDEVVRLRGRADRRARPRRAARAGVCRVAVGAAARGPRRPSPEEAERFAGYWRAWGDHVQLEIVVSPYRATVAPLANYIDALHRQRPEITMTVVVPEMIVAKAWQRLLHNRIAPRLRAELIPDEGIVITTVPFHLPA